MSAFHWYAAITWGHSAFRGFPQEEPKGLAEVAAHNTKREFFELFLKAHEQARLNTKPTP
jgi:hypothetical protein